MQKKSLIEVLQNKIYTDIPLTQHMGIKVIDYKPFHLTLAAPLENNINHRLTVFGGSIASLGILVCWGLIYLELYQRKIKARIVIQNSHINYLKPISNEFNAICQIINDNEFNRFLNMLQRKKIARIKLSANIICKKQLLADFVGDFVAIKHK